MDDYQLELICQWCRGRFTSKRSHAKTCCKACRQALSRNNRNETKLKARIGASSGWPLRLAEIKLERLYDQRRTRESKGRKEATGNARLSRWAKPGLGAEGGKCKLYAVYQGQRFLAGVHTNDRDYAVAHVAKQFMVERSSVRDELIGESAVIPTHPRFCMLDFEPFGSKP